MEQIDQLRPGRVRALSRLALDVVFPPECAFCFEPLGMVRPASGLCEACEGKVPWLTGTLCIRCGHPMPEGFEDDVEPVPLSQREREERGEAVIGRGRSDGRGISPSPQPSPAGRGGAESSDEASRKASAAQRSREASPESGASPESEACPSESVAERSRGASPKDRLCGMCLKERPRYHQARAACRYGDPVREALLALKYSRRLDLTHPLATLLHCAWRDAYPIGEPRPTLLTAVPLHPVRLRLRHFDQARLLCTRLATRVRTLAAPDLLRRVRDTSSQRGLSRNQRRENVRGAFGLRQRHCEGAHVLLIDDVYTTGATVNECTKVLLRQGKAARVDVLCVARAVKE